MALSFAFNKVQREAMSNENNPRFTRSQAARVKSHNVEDDIVYEDSVSQVTDSARRTSSRVSSSFSSRSMSSRSKEKLDLDISALAIEMNSQQRRAQLVKKKLDVELEIEKNDLQKEMDLAINERKSLDRENSVVQTPEQNKGTLDNEIQKILDDCCTYLGSGKVDLNGKKACRVYKNVNRTSQKSIEPENTKIPRTSTVKKETEKLAKYVEPISVRPSEG